MESTSMRTITMSMLIALAGPQGWSELPYQVLESIIRLLSCTRDLLAFIATCPSWRAAFMSAKPRLCKLFPPLMIQSSAQLSNDESPDGEVHHTWQLMDPANPAVRYHRPVPLAARVLSKKFVGCSYGHAIFANWGTRRVSIVDVFTGVDVSPPPLPAAMAIWSLGPTVYCALTAPMSSAKACLLVSARHGLFVWRVGSSVWKEHIYASDSVEAEPPIRQIVVFQGKIMAMCPRLIRLCRVHLKGPQLDITIRELPMAWGEDAQNRGRMIRDPRLVVCGDRLILAVSSWAADGSTRVLFYCYEPSRWLPVPAPDLDHAVFKGSYIAMQMLSSANPSNWGGRGGNVYGPGYFDNEVYRFTGGRLLPSWVTPSVLTWEEEESEEPEAEEEEEGHQILPCVRRSKRARKPVDRLNL